MSPVRSPESPAVTAHGIGHADYAALVFSGSRHAIGEAAGYLTWKSPRKFVLPDPRLPPADDFASAPGRPLPVWPGSVRPTPGICFCLSDRGHPLVAALLSHDAVEFEHFVVLQDLSRESLLARRLDRFLAAAGPSPVAILGFGDQGRRIAHALESRPDRRSPIRVVDDNESARTAAAAAGLVSSTLSDVLAGRCALVSSPFSPPPAFRRALHTARKSGLATLDNSLPCDERPQFRASSASPRLFTTAAAERSLRLDGDRIRSTLPHLSLDLTIIRQGRRRLGPLTMPYLASVGAVTLPPASTGPRDSSVGIDSASPAAADLLSHLEESFERAYIGLRAQSNHHDAAMGIFAARELLRTCYPETVDSLLPCDHPSGWDRDVHFGATPFERHLARSTTGRSPAAPFMTACEQTALGLLAAAHSPDAPIIEIGSALGGSALLMAAATAPSNAQICSIDPDRSARPVMQTVFELAGHAHRLRQITDTSFAAASLLTHLHAQAGLVFIDGLHTAAAVADDIDACAPLVRPGGCLVLHDADIRHPGVIHAAAERLTADARFQPLVWVDSLLAFRRLPA